MFVTRMSTHWGGIIGEWHMHEQCLWWQHWWKALFMRQWKQHFLAFGSAPMHSIGLHQMSSLSACRRTSLESSAWTNSTRSPRSWARLRARRVRKPMKPSSQLCLRRRSLSLKSTPRRPRRTNRSPCFSWMLWHHHRTGWHYASSIEWSVWI